ncbi:MATE family efflux transporter [Lachnospiraceae bacterium CLA-AA-H215]|uniref:MATE family efflux transporter n=1 Tax=Hominifimenecus microfluidus TaxID=2885348 RepID=A0AAE3E9Y1_9FIRM|nr:MATE family efflux transporter [Hominifimenecus microfluidus]MCC2230757.1 MATE family efflux transporter [Hominifimenecus microfluidus]
MKANQGMMDLTKGSIAKGLVQFTIPVIFGQILQQLYSIADAWVLGNYADNTAFAAVSSTNSLIFLMIGLFNGTAIGGGVVISRYFGAKDEKGVEMAIHTNVLFGLIASVLVTLAGLFLIPQMIKLMKVPEDVLPQSLLYFRIYFAGSATVILYNVFTSIMRALGDSIHPLYYLAFSSVVNVVLDLLLVAKFHQGVAGAAFATVLSQGLSMLLCLMRMRKSKDYTRISWKKIKWYPQMMKKVIQQGLPAGIQNSVISIGNVVIQTNINAFGEFAMTGAGAHSKIEGFVFIPITSMVLTLPTFISQNLGAKEYDRAKKGALFGILTSVILAEGIGLIVYVFSPQLIHIFAKSEEAVRYGVIQERIMTLFYGLMAFSHSATGVLRGSGRSIVPMVTMLGIWCGVRVLYVTIAIQIVPVFQTICWAYPLTWGLSSIVFLIYLLKSNWLHTYDTMM